MCFIHLSICLGTELNQIKYITEWGQDGRVRKTLNFCLSKRKFQNYNHFLKKTINENSLKAIRKDFSQLK